MRLKTSSIYICLFLMTVAVVHFSWPSLPDLKNNEPLTVDLMRLSLKVEKLSESIGSLKAGVLEIKRNVATIEDDRISCMALLPEYVPGVGVLQVTSVLASRGDDVEKFAENQVKRLKMLIHQRGADSQFSSSLSHYLGRGEKPVQRVVFNNLSLESGAQMCTWLRCEKWTGGCAFIDEKGVTHAEDSSQEFAPDENIDLYLQWKMTSISGKRDNRKL